MATSSSRPGPGRPPAASREEVLAEAVSSYLRSERVEVGLVAERTGVARASVHRWFGSRAGLLGEVNATLAEDVIARAAAARTRSGASGPLEALDTVARTLSVSAPLRRFLEEERTFALAILTSSNGVVQPRTLAALRALIEEEMQARRLSVAIDAGTLAFALVRLFDAFIYNDAAAGIRGDRERLLSVCAALLGIGTGAAAPR